jgi:RNA polymerase-associated protein RTF1
MKSSSKRIIAAMTTLTHYSFTSEEITKKVAKQDELRKIATQPDPKLIAKFTAQRAQALEDDNLEEVERLDEEIRNVGPVKLAFGRELYPLPKKDTETSERKLTEGERIAALNARNRKLNTENVRRAQIAERRAKQRAEEAYARGEGEADTFARIKTRPKTNYDAKNPHSSHLAVPRDDLFDGSGTDRSRAGTPMSGTETPKKSVPRRATTPVGSGRRPGEPIGMIRGRADDDEVIANMEVELDPDVAGALGL